MTYFNSLQLMTILLSLTCLWPAGQASTLVYCSEGSPTAFNPQITTDGTSNNASAHTVYNRLIEFKYGTTELTPALAESWTISKDKKTYTFNLRKDVKFHKTSYFEPTRDFNADDVLFSFNRMFKKDHPYHNISGGAYEYFNGMGMGDLIKSIQKIDDYTVEIELNEPEAPFLANMAMSFMSILSAEYGEKLAKKENKEQIDRQPIGTGPFVFKAYRKDALIRYTGFDSHFQGAPKLDRLIFAITPESSVRLQKLKVGECHVVIEPPPSDLPALKKNPQFQVKSGPGFNIGYLAMNTQKKPFDNKLVRQAMRHALDKEAYIKAIYLGHAKKAKNPVPPGLWSYHDGLEAYDYNPEKARALLKKAGLPDGFKAELWTLPVTRPYNPSGRRMGEMMQADLKKIGVEINLISYDWPTYLKKSRNGEHALIQLGWTGDNGDPDNFLHTLLGCDGVQGGSNVAKWCHKEFDELVLKAKRETEVKARTPLYKKAQEIFHEQSPWVPIAHSTVFRALSQKVKGYKLDPLGGDQFRLVDIK